MSYRRQVFFMLLVWVLWPLIFAVAAQESGEVERTGLRPDAPPYAIRGPHWVGVVEFTIEDAERPLTGHIWYPARKSDEQEESIVYDLGAGDLIPPMLNQQEGKAILDGEPDLSAAPYPLVVSSHGLGSAYAITAYLHEHLASYGFVVIAFDHIGNALVDNLMAGDEEGQTVFWEKAIDSLVLRPMDILHVIDYAEVLTAEDGMMANLIDVDHTAVIGVSYGGYTALAAAGAQLELSSLLPFCEQGIYNTMIGAQLCNRYPDNLSERESQLIELAGLEAEPGGMLPTLGDPRVDAIVAIVPVAVVFGEDGLNNVNIPAMLLAGGGDVTAVAQYNVFPAYEHISSANKTLVTFENAGHGFPMQCPEPWIALNPLCADSVWDMDRAHDLTDHFTTAFLLAELYGDADAAAALTPNAVNFPGITYETTGF